MAPEWSKAAEELKKNTERSVALAKVDATIEKALAEKFDIKGIMI